MRGAKVNVPRLYRHILKNAAVFPSIKRASMIEEIKQDFRDGVLLRDEREVAEAIARAEKGLEQLQVYTKGLDKSSEGWVITTEDNPMQRPAAPRQQ